jgi:riboflavin kinase/FMN adenylyltransferase
MTFVNSDNFTARDTCVAFGQFDGLHAGHMAVLSTLKEKEKCGYNSVMLKLEDQDLQQQAKCLTVPEDMRRILQDNGPQIVALHPAVASDIHIEPEKFITEILLDKMGAKVVVAGAGCRFGKDKRGNVQMLKEHAALHGFELCIVEMVYEDEAIITSDIIREDILSGNLERANRMLGNKYTLRGEVVHGKALGRGAKMPTANLQPHESKLIPAHGVYATLTKVDGEYFRGLTNIGLRPTVDDLPHVTIETFLLDFSRDIYGKIIETELSLFVRETRKFNDLNEVRAQIDIDLEQIQKHFDKNWEDK